MAEEGHDIRTRTSIKILVVDDEPDLASLMRLKFRRQIRAGQFEFVDAPDGVAALELLRKEPEIDIVLTDLNMPRMDGLTLLARILELGTTLKAVVVTAYGDMENIRMAMNRGAFDFLTKPIDLGDLEITINKAKETVEQQRRAQLAREMFGRYLSDEVAEQLLGDPEALRLGGEKRRVTVLMADLRGFSYLAEGLPPERVVEILNIFLGRMANVIMAYHGTIDEFIGDGILAMFGAPLQAEGDARRAVACALAMQQAMAEVNAEVARIGYPPLEMGIGINTGEVVVGNIGSQRRVKYGVVGSHVNLAGRIESFSVGGQVLVTAHTLADAGPDVRIGRRMELSVKGFSEPVAVYDVEAVGEPYDLELPRREERLVELDRPHPVRLALLDGKHLTGTVYDGRVTALSATGALLRTDAPLSMLSDLKVWFTAPGGSGELLGDLYGKIVDAEEGAPARLRFTAIPEMVSEAIGKLIGKSD